MKPITALRIKSSLWFACLFLVVMLPIALMASVLTLVFFWGDSPERLLWLKTWFWAVVIMPSLGFLVAYTGSSTTKTGDEVKDEKSLRALTAVFREIIREFTFGLIG